MLLRGAGAARAGAAVVVLAVACAVVVLPLARLVGVAWSAGAGGLAHVVSSPSFGVVVRNTLVLAAAVTLAAVPLGTATALVLRRPDVPARGLWRVLVLLPVLVPDFVLGYSWTQAYGRGGFIDGLLGWNWGALPGAVQVWLVLVVNAVPVAYLVVAAGLATRAEPQLTQAARISGAGGGTALVTVTLRLLGPAIAAAAVLVFVLSLGAFAVPQVLGTPAGFRTVATQIYADLSLGADPSAFAEAVTLALLLVLLAAACVAPVDAVLGRRLRAPRTSGGDGVPVGAGRPAVGRWVAAGLGGYLLLTVGLPLAALVLASVIRAVGVPPTPANWGLAHYREVLDPRTFEALGRSAVLAVTAATVLLALSALVAVVEGRRGGRAVTGLLTLTFVLPGSTLAVAMLLTYRRWLADTAALILVAYLAKFWAFAQRPLSGAVDRLVADEWRAARVSGAGPVTAVRTVLLRALAPVLAGAWLLCLLTALHEVTMSSLLYGPGSETFAVVVLNSQELGRIGPTAALSVVLTLLVAVPALLLGLVTGRVRAAGARAGSPVSSAPEAARVG
jgi:iron(III) transport system permease protein